MPLRYFTSDKPPRSTRACFGCGHVRLYAKKIKCSGCSQASYCVRSLYTVISIYGLITSQTDYCRKAHLRHHRKICESATPPLSIDVINKFIAENHTQHLLMALHAFDVVELLAQNPDFSVLLEAVQLRACSTAIAYTLVLGQYDPCLPLHHQIRLDPFSQPFLPASSLPCSVPIRASQRALSIQLAVRLYSWGSNSFIESVGVLKVDFNKLVRLAEQHLSLACVVRSFNILMDSYRIVHRCTCP